MHMYRPASDMLELVITKEAWLVWHPALGSFRGKLSFTQQTDGGGTPCVEHCSVKLVCCSCSTKCDAGWILMKRLRSKRKKRRIDQ